MVSFKQQNSFLLQPKPGGLQELQTEIYRQLQLLIPDQIAHYDSFQSRVHGSPLLRMDILERHPFTHFVRLTYQFDTKDTLEVAPDAHIRIYNDARLAEATSFDQAQGFTRQANGPKQSSGHSPATYNSPNSGSRSHPLSPSHWFPPVKILQRSWRQNQALDKWLSYLLHQGHSLTTMQPASDKITGKQAIPVNETSRSA
jgi:uncharacterized protein YqiB (DUF1249 family)